MTFDSLPHETGLSLRSDFAKLAPGRVPDNQAKRQVRAGSSEMNDAVSMAVIGVGYFGKFHAEKIANLPGAKLVAVSDLDRERAQAVAETNHTEVVADYRDLLGKVDAVSVVVPTDAHYQVARDFLEHGADVLLEKPITKDVTTAAELVEIANANGRILQVGHLERFSGMFESLRKRIDRPLFIDSVRITPFKMRGTDINVILDLMIHDLDLVLCIVDSPILSLDAVGAPVFSDAEDIASVRIKFANGCVASIVASRISLKTERKMRIFEHNQYISVDFDNRTIRTFLRPQGASANDHSMVTYEKEDYRDGDALNSEIAAFVDSVIHRREPLVTGQAGVEALKAATMVTESLRAHMEFVASSDFGLSRSKESA